MNFVSHKLYNSMFVSTEQEFVRLIIQNQVVITVVQIYKLFVKILI